MFGFDRTVQSKNHFYDFRAPQNGRVPEKLYIEFSTHHITFLYDVNKNKKVDSKTMSVINSVKSDANVISRKTRQIQINNKLNKNTKHFLEKCTS